MDASYLFPGSLALVMTIGNNRCAKHGFFVACRFVLMTLLSFRFLARDLLPKPQ